MKMERNDLIFLLTYFFEELKGNWQKGSTTNSNHDLLSHFLTKIVGIQTNGPKMQLLDLLNNIDQQLIIIEGKKLYEEWQLKPDIKERILMVGTNLARIKNLFLTKEAIQSIEYKKSKEEDEFKEKEKIIIGSDRKELISKDIEAWSIKTGKRFRRKAEELRKGLSREEAFALRMQMTVE